MNGTPRHPLGLTLLETLVAIAIFGGLLFVATSLVRDIGDSRRRTESRMRIVEGATVVLDALASRLAVATVSDASGGSGIVGDSTALRVTGSGVSIRRLAMDSSLSPLVDRATIELQLDSDGLAISEEGSDRSTLVPDLYAVRFRYHDGSEWRDAWDSGTDGLPVAVEARLWFDPWTEGRYPDWMPSPDERVDEEEPSGELDEFGDLDEFEDFNRSTPIAVAMEEAPAPDRVRVIALIDPVSLDDEESSSDEEPFAEDFP